jgi:hypothetical protein
MKKKKKHANKKAPVTVSPSERVREFRGHPLEAMPQCSDSVRCVVCNKAISTEITSIKKHLFDSKSHQANTEKARTRDGVMMSLNSHFAASVKGEGRVETMTYRFRVISDFLRMGISLNKLQDPGLRNLIEDSKFRDLSSMR